MAFKLGKVLGEKGARVLIARDVRLSSPALEKRLICGLLENEAAEIFTAGILPTPALAYFAKIYRADFAVMITASHNAPDYNGLKIFGKSGKKLSPDAEKQLDEAVHVLFAPQAEKANSAIGRQPLAAEQSIAAPNDTAERCKIGASDNFRFIVSESPLSSSEASLCASNSAISSACDTAPLSANLATYASETSDKFASCVGNQIGQNPEFSTAVSIQSFDAAQLAACDDEGFSSFAEIPHAHSVTSIQGADVLYKNEVLRHFPRFDNMKVRLDLANGCYARFAADVFSALGVIVEAENNERDGSKVNVKCGSTNVASFAKRVKRDEIGFAFDGDGDRVLAVVDNKVYDGDAILLAISLLYRLRGKLKNRFVVGTALTNTRLQRELAYHGSALIRADVGDKYVLDAMLAKNCLLGGEKSGHIIMLDKSDTGDGLLTALTLLEVKKTMGSLPVFSAYPMLEFNIPSKSPSTDFLNEDFKSKAARAQEEIEGIGRLIIRPSGTEPYIRVAAEVFSGESANVFKKIKNIFIGELN